MNFNASSKSINIDKPILETIRQGKIAIEAQNTTQTYEEIDFNSEMITNNFNNSLNYLNAHTDINLYSPTANLGYDPLSGITFYPYSNGIYETVYDTDSLFPTLKNIPIVYKSITYSNIYNQGYTPQSIVRIDDKVLITAYSKEPMNPSKIYVYNENSDFEGVIILDNSSHVGGISYDQKNKILYVTNDYGKIEAYDYSKLLNTMSEKNSQDTNIRFSNLDNDKPFIIDLFSSPLNASYYKIKSTLDVWNVNEGSNTPASTIYYYNNKLYVGKFDNYSNGSLVILTPEIKYDSFGNKTISMNEEKITVSDAFPRQVQGIAVTEYEGKNYMIISSSIGTDSSKILVYDYNINTNEISYKGCCYTGPNIEGISINEKNMITFVFEKFSNMGMSSGNDYTLETTMEILLNNIRYDDVQQIESSRTTTGFLAEYVSPTITPIMSLISPYTNIIADTGAYIANGITSIIK